MLKIILYLLLGYYKVKFFEHPKVIGFLLLIAKNLHVVFFNKSRQTININLLIKNTLNVSHNFY